MCMIHTWSRQADLEGVDIIFAAGGDGTFLKAASRLQRDVPILVSVYVYAHVCAG